MRLGNIQGSDAIEESYDLDLNKFDIAILELNDINSTSKDIIFDVIGVNDTNSKNLKRKKSSLSENFEHKHACIRKTFEHLGFGNEYVTNIHSKIENLVSFLTSKGIPILQNRLKYSKEYRHINFTQYMDPETKMIKVCNNMHLFDFVWINPPNENSKEFVVIEPGTSKCEGHIDICKQQVVVKDNLYIDVRGDMYIGSKKISKTHLQLRCPKDFERNSDIKRHVTKYIFFDYETVVDSTQENIMIPYSLSIFICDQETLTRLSEHDRLQNVSECETIRSSACHTFIGHDCTKQFIDFLNIDQIYESCVLIGFNNVCFDNLILYKDIKQNSKNLNITDQIFACGGLLNFKIQGKHANIDTFDLSKHLVGSLASLCKGFGVKVCAKRSFDHEFMQGLYNSGQLFDWISLNRSILLEYNEYDVISLAIIFTRYRDALLIVKESSGYAENLTQSKTIGGLTYNIFCDHVKNIANTLDFVPEKDDLPSSEDSLNSKNMNIFPKLPYKIYNDLLNGKSAGRVQCFQGKTKIEESIVSYDVCSLYPYTMACNSVYYPYGNIVETGANYFNDDLIGFYYTTFDQSNLKHMNLPLILPLKKKDHLDNIIENDYNSRDGICTEPMLISSVDIQQLRKYGCKYKIHSGFYFTHKIKSCELFQPILRFMQAKNHQDSLKKTGASEYNAPLRETLKLFMNSLSGKVIEGLHVDKMKIFNCTQLDELKDFFAQQTNVKFIQQMGDDLHVSYEIDPTQRKILLKQRPVYLGALIYAYSRQHMYNYGYSRIGLDKLLYTDTDSIKFPKKYEELYQQNVRGLCVPHWEEVEEYDPKFRNHKLFDHDSKVFGSFEDELDGYENNLFYCLQKKVWLVCNLQANNEVANVKWRGKGFNAKSYNMIASENIGANDSTKSNGSQYRFFEHLFQIGSIDLRCVSFRKIVGSLKRNAEADPSKFEHNFCSIQVNTTIKTIKLDDIEYPESRIVDSNGCLRM